MIRIREEEERIREEEKRIREQNIIDQKMHLRRKIILIS